jgi:hypothetical protein
MVIAFHRASSNWPLLHCITHTLLDTTPILAPTLVSVGFDGRQSNESFACHPLRPTRSHRGLKRCKRSRWTNTGLTQVSAHPVLISLPSESTGQIRTAPPLLGTAGTDVMLEALTAHIRLFKVTGRAWCAHTVMRGSYTALCHASDKGQRCYTPWSTP